MLYIQAPWVNGRLDIYDAIIYAHTHKHINILYKKHKHLCSVRGHRLVQKYIILRKFVQKRILALDTNGLPPPSGEVVWGLLLLRTAALTQYLACVAGGMFLKFTQKSWIYNALSIVPRLISSIYRT